MIIYEEEYRVKITRISEFLERIEEFKQMVDKLDTPFLKDWYIWQDRYTPGLIRNVWVVEEQANIEQLWEECFIRNEEWSNLVPQIFELMVDGSYKYSFWKPITQKI